MPELPEVYNVVRDLKEFFVGEIIDEVIPKGKFLSIDFSSLKNKKVIEIERKGKNIFFIFENFIMTSHLKMTGTYIFEENLSLFLNERKKDEENNITFILRNKRKIIYQDIRLFTLRDFKIQKLEDYKNISPYKNIGFDLLEDYEDIINNLDKIFYKISLKNLTIKEEIMNQKIISGIGNIYASEALFCSKILPDRKCFSLSKENYYLIIKEARRIIIESSKDGGTSISDFISPKGIKGKYGEKMMVYGRRKKQCFVCNETIKEIFINSRITFFCSRCQI